MNTTSSKSLSSGKTLTLQRETVRTLKVRSGVAAGNPTGMGGSSGNAPPSVGVSVTIPSRVSRGPE